MGTRQNRCSNRKALWSILRFFPKNKKWFGFSRLSFIYWLIINKFWTFLRNVTIHSVYIPGKQNTVKQWRVNVGTSSATAALHWPDIASPPCVCWADFICRSSDKEFFIHNTTCLYSYQGLYTKTSFIISCTRKRVLDCKQGLVPQRAKRRQHASLPEQTALNFINSTAAIYIMRDEGLTLA